MKKRFVFSLVSALVVISWFAELPAQIRHRALVSGCMLGYVAIVNDTGFEWKHADNAYAMCDIWLLPSGNIVYPYQAGVRIIRPDFANAANDRVVWDRPTAAGGETHSCQPLDGSSSKFLIGESYDTISYIIEIDTTGKIWKKISLPRFGSGSHNQFRQIRKTEQKTYLVTQQAGGGTAFEYDSTGKLLRTFPDGRYGAERLSNGNTLIACGDNSRIIEVNPANQIVWDVGRDSIPGVTLGFVGGLARLANGNTIVTNWGGHVSGTNLGASVFEVTRDKKVVWRVSPVPEYMISAVQILDDLLPPYVPVLLAPADTAKKQSTGLQLSWNSVPGSPVYHVQLSISASFSPLLVNDSSATATSLAVGPLAAGTTYYWRVAAKNGNGASAWSKARSFTTAPASSVLLAEQSRLITGTTGDSRTIRFAVSKGQQVSIRLYTVQGRLVKTLCDSYLQPGQFAMAVTHADFSGGTLVVNFKTAGFNSIQKISMVR